jgi:protein SCO1/2
VNPRHLIALALAAAFALGMLVVVAVAGRDDGGEGATETGPGARFEGARLPGGVRAPDFALTDQDGAPVSMRALRGETVIVTFLYTHCEDSCPPQAQQIKGALNELGRDVPALAIAVDPPNDTEQSARRFLAKARMTGRMDFVLGSRAELAPLWEAYAVQPQSRKAEHQARIVLVDRRGMQRVGYPLEQATPERIAHDLRLLEAERS